MTNRDFISKAEAFGERVTKLFSNFKGDFDAIDLSSLVVNSCDDCPICCQIPRITKEQYAEGKLPPTPAKKMGEMCRYCDGKSCQVYDSRPEICKGYLCLWKFGLTDRPPSESGIAWTYEINHETMNCWVLVGHTFKPLELLQEEGFAQELTQLSSVRPAGLSVDFVVLRSPTTGTRMIKSGNNEWMVEHLDLTVNEDGSVIPDMATLQYFKCTPLQTESHGNIV